MAAENRNKKELMVVAVVTEGRKWRKQEPTANAVFLEPRKRVLWLP